MKNKYRVLKILVVAILFGFLLNFSLNRFHSRDYKLHLNFEDGQPVYFITEAMVDSVVLKNSPSPKVIDVDISGVERALDKLPQVDSANVYLSLNGGLNVDISQRVPIMRIKDGNKDYYVDHKGVAFPLSHQYAHPAILVSGAIPEKDYPDLIHLIDLIGQDDFAKKYFVGISRNKKGDYELLTDQGYFTVELGPLQNLEFKLKGFKTFLEKYLVYQAPEKYKKISVKYENQIVATRRDGVAPAEEEADETQPANTVTAQTQ